MQGQGDVHRQGLVCQLGGCEEWLLFEDLPGESLVRSGWPSRRCCLELRWWVVGDSG